MSINVSFVNLLTALTVSMQPLPGVRPPSADFCVVTQHSRLGAQRWKVWGRRGGVVWVQEQIPAFALAPWQELRDILRPPVSGRVRLRDGVGGWALLQSSSPGTPLPHPQSSWAP